MGVEGLKAWGGGGMRQEVKPKTSMAYVTSHKAIHQKFNLGNGSSTTWRDKQIRQTDRKKEERNALLEINTQAQDGVAVSLKGC
jgi:hypothetical protein